MSVLELGEDNYFFSGESLLDVSKKINSNGLGVCFYISTEFKIIGVLTDGDFRRALISGAQLSSQASEAASTVFQYGYIYDGVDVWINKISNEIKILPLVDADLKLVGYFAPRDTLFFQMSGPKVGVSEIANVGDALASGWISSHGSYVENFETAFARYCDTKFGCSTMNGTTALHLALIGIGVEPGDEVIVPDLTFAATINAVLHAGATPVIVDVETDSWCICPDAIEQAITCRTKAVIVVHLCGQVAQMSAIMKLASKYNLKVIEDCAEAHGARFDGKPVGSIGHVGCFSFFSNKIMSTGEGGMCITSCPMILETMKIAKNHGMSPAKKYWHISIGYNYRMTNIQAALGLAQLTQIDNFLDIRRQYEDGYRKVFDRNRLSVTFQKDLKLRARVVWLVSVLMQCEEEKLEIQKTLSEHRIDSRSFFYPLSSMPIYEKFCGTTNLKAKEISARGLFLPTFNSPENLHELLTRLKGILG